MFNKPAALFAASFIASFAAPAFAKDVVEFQYQASELEAPGGSEAVYAKLASRAERLCYNGQESLRRLEAACEYDLKSQWVAAIDDPGITAAHEMAYNE